MIERKRGRLTGQEIKLLRREVVGISQSRFGDWLAVKRPSVSNWETEQHRMPWAAEVILRMVASEAVGKPLTVRDAAWLMRQRSSLDGA